MICYEDFKFIIKQYILKEWQDEWSGFQSFLSSIKPEIGNWETSYHKCRKDEIVLSRLRLGCTLIDVKHIFDRSPLPICDTCGTRITAEHILLHCTKYSQYRLLLNSYLREKAQPMSMPTVLDNSQVIYWVINFLKKSNTLNQL